MPAWWSRKSKSRCNSGHGAAREEEEGGSAGKADIHPIKKEKAKSFDGAVAGGKWSSPGDRRLLSFDYESEKRPHPLPPPLMSPSPRLPPQFRCTGAGTNSTSSATARNARSESTSTSASSVSSSGTDDAADLGFCRYSEPVNTPKARIVNLDSQEQLLVGEDGKLFSSSPVLEREKVNVRPISPRKEFILPGPPLFPIGIGNSYGRTTTDGASTSQPSPGSGSRGYNLSASPTHAKTVGINLGSPTGKYDDLKGLHPLPLPPGSPSSLASCPLQTKWKKGKLLGHGTFGHVFLGFNSQNGQMCAIKEVRVISDDSDSKESLKQLSQEIALLSQLSHPKIVRYLGSELVEETLSVYLEFVSGGSIHKLLQEYGPFEETVIRSYAAQILSGLAYLHGKNTVHRDIKGANILVDPNGEVKLADFGMAKHVSSCTSIQSFKGSPYWMAPEVIMSSTGGYNLSVDIWSFGCTIIEMATSKPPWSQYEGVAAIFKVVNSREIPEIPAHLSNEGKDFLRLCLQRSPSARPTAAQLMEHPFVRDKATVRTTAKPTLAKDAFLSPSDGRRSPTTEFPYHPSNSPLRDGDYPMWHTVNGFPAVRSPSDLAGPRMNMSLPVSPSSSPLRNFRQPNRSCLSSPPHPLYGSGVLNDGAGNYLSNPVPFGSSANPQDPWLEIHHGRYQRP